MLRAKMGGVAPLSASLRLGDVQSKWLGDWQVGRSYVPLDKVNRGGSSFVCVRPCTAVDPLVDVGDGVEGQYWILIARKGDTGAAFTYDMFTEEQLEALRGPEGPSGERGPAGDTGVGIEKVELTGVWFDSGNGGKNEYTITMTDGSTFSFTVKDGKPGSKGETGANGVSSIIHDVYRTERTTEEGVVYEMRATVGGQLHFFEFVVPFGPEGPAGPAGSGSGDMTASVYDPQGKAQDIFKYVDEKLKDVDFDVTADEVTFADGETFQQKYDSGDLTGPAGPAGKDGQDGQPGATGADGQPGAAGKDATINGVNALTIGGNGGVAASQSGSQLNLSVSGTFGGQAVANPAAVADTSVAQLRNIFAGTTDLVDGVSALAPGDIYVVI